MDLNLIGKKDNIVIDFRLMANINNLCTITYDIKRKITFTTWQHGSIDRDLIMLCMNRYTEIFTNGPLLLKTPSGVVVDDIQAIYDEYWMIIVEFDTMKIDTKKQIETVTDFISWQLFIFKFFL
ncbi:unnamed protein product [Adineta steineri]|uniref:Uncharacterized protein n=1 Tax=Adineta steineri TaxID=433720 RepID=A0A818XHW0_9BILA|nr:unnamed protein product [Adineta steineri]CAF0833393.1 unnamed protein product [Adineta steineri]CAF3737322.1 unnamed protein product [Adineta steineri]CAF3811703.1 unnamed protein product [Adineta steineri]